MSDVMSVRLHLSGVRVRGVGVLPLWVPLLSGVGQEAQEGS